MITTIQNRATTGKVMSLSTLLSALMAAFMLLAAAAQLAAPAVAATTFAVDRNDDPDPATANACTDAPEDCSLRGAIVAANAATGEDAITVPAGTYTLTRAGADEGLASTGDLNVKGELTINGAGARTTSVSGGPVPFDDRIFEIQPGVKATITGLTITGGDVGGYEGGGVRNHGDLTLERVDVKDNAALSGGGIDSRGGDLTLDGVTVKGNTSTTGYGGGIYSEKGTLNMTDSTVSGNSAETGGGLSHYSGTANITNSTISGNKADLSGGGLLAGSASMNVRNSTIASNTSGGLGGGILTVGASSTVVVKNTIVAGNSLVNCGDFGQAGGVIFSQGNNISSDDSCHFIEPTDRQDTNPRLGPLQDNGGPTDTHALLPRSPAIDAAGASACPSRDQRGVARKDGNGDGTVVCDVGAFEAPTNTRPTISNPRPAPGSTTRDRTPSIAATVRDTQSDLAKPDIKLFVDGNRRDFSYDRSTDRLSFTPGSGLTFGKHTVKVMADDSVLSATRSWSFSVVRG